MAYRTVSIHHLSAYQFKQAEAGFAELSEKELAPLIKKSGGNFSNLISQLHQGSLVLLTDSPTLPMMIRDPDNFGSANNWILNPNAVEKVSAAAKNAYQNRLNMCHGYTMSNRQPSTRSLHPPLPMPPYTPEPPIPSRSKQRPPLNYEYSFEIACSKDSFRQGVGGHFTIERTEKDILYGRWNEHKTEHGIRYTEYLAYNEPKRLSVRIASVSFGISPKQWVKVRTKGSQIADEAFIPVTPAVQVGGRLGFPCQGFYYHVYQGELVQEYRIIGGNDWSYYATRSYHQRLNAERGYNKDQTAILVYWRLGGKVVHDQYLFYLDRQITRDELDNLTPQWMEKHGVKLDLAAMLEAVRQPEVEQQVEEKKTDSTPAEPVNHLVAIDPQTGERESWRHIAAQYNLAPLELLKLNPSYEADPMSLAVGHSLRIKKPTPPRKETIYGLPAVAPQTYHQALNCVYNYPARHLNNHHLPVKSLTCKPFVMQDIAIVNLRPERTLRIGVFFDGTGQNNDNDRYKESRGDKSRSNIARLFEAYPQEMGVSEKIYVSGVGTVDGAYQTPAIIDRGEDETPMALALGVEVRNALKGKLDAIALYNPIITAGLNLATVEMLEKTGAFYKWQSYLKQFADLVDLLTNHKIYQDITHIEFDVFGFSRGAALARHFVNAALEGLPDFQQPRDGEDTLPIWPNLLGTEQGESYNRSKGYHVDEQRRVSVRFVGLFDTVGSFYLPGNRDDGNFKLTLAKGCARKVVQLCAHHEYRHNFPLTSLKTDGQLPDGFYEEVFPGAHSDVGGGYPASEQYDKSGLPERYGIPTQNSYNRELVREAVQTDLHQQGINYSALSIGYDDKQNKQNQLKARVKSEQASWSQQCQTDYNQYGLVTFSHDTLYYYRLQPVNNALAGLTQERMKQQAALAGIEWDEKDYELPKDFQQNPELQQLSQTLLAQPLGEIGPEQWQQAIQPQITSSVHRPHDELINPGCDNAMAWLINRPNKRGNTELYREIYDNENSVD